jgi:hypothetical protein
MYVQVKTSAFLSVPDTGNTVNTTYAGVHILVRKQCTPPPSHPMKCRPNAPFYAYILTFLHLFYRRGLYFGKYPPPREEEYQLVSFGGKNMKREEKKMDNVEEK